MLRKNLTLIIVLLLALVTALPVMAQGGGQPDFTSRIYADGKTWGTKVIGPIAAPNENNEQSYDKFFVVTNSNNPGSQLPVGEAAPGRGYNGGRWWTFTVTWTQAGFVAHGTVPLLKSYDDIMTHYDLGHLTISEGSPEGGPPAYFLCPLLPDKTS